MYSEQNIARYGQLFKAAQADVRSIGKAAGLSSMIAEHPIAATGTALAGGLGLGGMAGGALGSMFRGKADEEKRLQTRNRAFGAGFGAGAATPIISKRITPMLQQLGILPGGEGY